MTNSKNFTAGIKKNTTEEMVEVLKAIFIEKKKVYFYVWNAYLSRMEVNVIDSKLNHNPNFDIWHYDLTGDKVTYKSAIKFQKNWTTAVETVKFLPSGDLNADINVWYDKAGILHIENVANNVQFHQNGISSSCIPLPYNVPKSVDTPVPQEKNPRVYALWKKICDELKKNYRHYRTAQPNKNKFLLRFDVSDLRSSVEYYAVIRLKDCVLVSREPLQKHRLSYFTVHKKDSGNINSNGSVVELGGILFDRHVPKD